MNIDSSNKRRFPGSLIIGVVVLVVFILIAIFADFIAPYDHREQVRSQPNAPASYFNFSSHGLVVVGSKLIDPVAQEYELDTSAKGNIDLFVKGYRYRLLGLFPIETHLFGSENDVHINLLGTDALGRDRFSRLLVAIRFSLIVCPLGALLASLLGILIGLVSGYGGRVTDTVLMGVADAVIAMPALIIILVVRVAFPLELPPLTAAALLLAIFIFAGWAEMARLSRGLVRKARGLDFVISAKVAGVRPAGVLFRHILPNIVRPLITQATLIIPAFLLAEAMLSFLGVGVQEPQPSLGNLLADANDVTQLHQHPILVLAPAIVIAVFVAAIRLLVKGLRERNEDPI